MTTAFELASTNAYQPWNINEAGGAYAVYNAHSRVSALRSAVRPAAVEAQDYAEISTTSALLAAAVAEPATRAEHLAALRQNILNGTYSVSSYRVAGALVESLL